MKNKSFTFIAAFIVTVTAATFMLSACNSNSKKALGLDHNAPDESNVLKRPPLSVPPDFHLPSPKEDEKLIKNKNSFDQPISVVTNPSQPNITSIKEELTASDQIFIRKFNKAAEQKRRSPIKGEKAISKTTHTSNKQPKPKK